MKGLEWLDVSATLKLEHGRGLDTHTNVILPAKNIPATKQSKRDQSTKIIETKDFLREQLNVRYLSQRTGRYDLTAAWGKIKEEKYAPMGISEFWKIYSEMPASFWSSIGAISTSVEKRLRSPSATVEQNHTTMEIVSHILLKH